MTISGQPDNEQIKKELEPVIEALEGQGITHNTKEHELTGLGDVIESTLKTFGITEERFKEFWNLKECNCTKRKKWLNNIFSWHKNNLD